MLPLVATRAHLTWSRKPQARYGYRALVYMYVLCRRYGYPALVAFNPEKGAYAAMRGTFEAGSIKTFVSSVRQVGTESQALMHAPRTALACL